MTNQSHIWHDTKDGGGRWKDAWLLQYVRDHEEILSRDTDLWAYTDPFELLCDEYRSYNHTKAGNGKIFRHMCFIRDLRPKDERIKADGGLPPVKEDLWKAESIKTTPVMETWIDRFWLNIPLSIWRVRRDVPYTKEFELMRDGFHFAFGLPLDLWQLWRHFVNLHKNGKLTNKVRPNQDGSPPGGVDDSEEGFGIS